MTRRAASQLFLANRTLSAAEALELGIVDRVASSHAAGLTRLETLDVGFLKELTVRSPGLSRNELLSLATIEGAGAVR